MVHVIYAAEPSIVCWLQEIIRSLHSLLFYEKSLKISKIYQKKLC